MLVKCASLALNSEQDGRPTQHAMSNDFSINLYIVEDRPQLRLAIDALNTIQISLDHFQYCQLHQLQKISDSLLEQIKKDRKFFEEKHEQNNEPLDIQVFAFIDRVSKICILLLDDLRHF